MSEWIPSRRLSRGDVYVYGNPPVRVLVVDHTPIRDSHTLLFPDGSVRQRRFDLDEWSIVVSRRPSKTPEI